MENTKTKGGFWVKKMHLKKKYMFQNLKNIALMTSKKVFLLLHQPVTKNQISVFGFLCCRNFKSEETKLYLLVSNCNNNKNQSKEFDFWFLVSSWCNKRNIHLFPDLCTFWFLEKTTLHENCVSGTVLMFQLTRNSPTNAYIR